MMEQTKCGVCKGSRREYILCKCVVHEVDCAICFVDCPACIGRGYVYREVPIARKHPDYWTSVDDAMPDMSHGFVDVWVQYGGTLLEDSERKCDLMHSSRGWLGRDNEVRSWGHLITHWRPAPEPPVF